MSTIDDLTESDLVARIQSHLPPKPDWLAVGIGDDAALIEPARNRLEALTVDALVEGVHFDRRFTPPEAIGHRALAVNLSDLSAMGAEPRLALLSLALPAGLPLPDFDAMVGGLARLAARYRVHVVGGNLTRSPGPLVIDVTVAGTVKRRQALTRSGARPGDALYVTGTIGAAAVGLELLQASRPPSPDPSSAAGIERYLRPEPRVRCGVLLARSQAATACMDLSDGLADAVRQVAAASGVGALVEAALLPLDPSVKARGQRHGTGQADLADWAVSRGDDYELLLSVAPRRAGRLVAARRHGGVPLTRIGVCTPAAEGIRLRHATGDSPMPFGYRHFDGKREIEN